MSGLLSATNALLKRAKGYNNRVMVYSHRRSKARYLPPKTPYVRSPLANKEPEEYGNTWDPHIGIEWYNRLRQRGAYRHWPWVRWSDDPIRQHHDPTCRRTLSCRQEASNECTPQWDYYAEVGRAYDVDPTDPITTVGTFIYPFVARVWCRSAVEEFLRAVASATGATSIIQVHEREREILAWAERGLSAIPMSRHSPPPAEDSSHTGLPARSAAHIAAETETEEERCVPKGFVQHLILVCRDIVLQHKRKQFRVLQHTQGAVLRTREMERYYALPYTVRGPAMPEELAQPDGLYPWGKYTQMNDDRLQIHPLHTPDKWYKDNLYPA